MAGFTSQKVPPRLIITGIVLVLLTIVAALALAWFDRHKRGETLFGEALPQKIFNAQYFRIDNGLEIIVVPNHRSPVITHMVWYKVGAADEPRGKSGIAHFLEHLMFKGSNGLAPGEFSETVRTLGGNDNAFTTQDSTAYFQSASKEHLLKLMQMESGRMRGMNPPEEEVLSEQNVIVEERRQRTDNQPSARLFEQMRAIGNINHPYGTPVIGWMHEIEGLKWPEIKGFYDRWYGPNNAVLVVTGDVTGEEVLDYALKTYGSIPRTNVPLRSRTASPPLPVNPVLTFSDATIHEPSVHLMFRAPSAGQDLDTSLALQVLEEIMGASSSTRLYESLVVEQKLATGISLSYNPWVRDHSEIWISASPAAGVTAEQLVEAVRVEMDKLITAGVGEDEIKAAKQRMQDATYFALDSLSGPAMIIGRAVTSGVKLDDIETWPYLIGKVTAEQVQNVAKIYLDMSAQPSTTSYVQGVLWPAKAALPAPQPQTSDAPHEEAPQDNQEQAAPPAEQPSAPVVEENL